MIACMSSAPLVPPTDAFFRAIVSTSSDAIISKDLSGHITSWNKGAEHMYGYTAGEAIGQPVSMLFPPEHFQEESRILERITRGEQIDHYETVRRRKDGSLIEISLTISPIYDASGRIIGASKIARDITSQRREQERLRVTLSSIGDGVISTDNLGRVTLLNAVAESLTGWTEKEALGRPYDEVLPLINETTRLPIESPMTVVLRENRIVELANHTLLVRRDGGVCPIDDSAAPIRSSRGIKHGAVMVFRDVTEHRKADLAARRLHAIVDGSDDAIISKNLQGVVTTWNRGAEIIFGYKAEEMIGQSILKLLPIERHAEEQQILARLQRGEKVDHFFTERLRKDGQRIHVSLTISPIRDAEGEIVGASKIARDITSLRETQARLEAHAHELEEKVRERTRALELSVAELEAFSYSLSHDMRAPLRSIRGLCEVVAEDFGSTIPEGVPLLQRAIASVDRLDRLIQDVLAAARASRIGITLERIELEPLVRGILTGRPDLAATGEIVVETPMSAVRGHESSLQQALTNLIDNAVKFTAPGSVPRVRIFTQEQGEQVRINVSDQGIGIDPAGRARLFAAFQRLDPEGPYPGSGVGLAIVRTAVERMRGRVGVESVVGLGSTFWIELPKA